LGAGDGPKTLDTWYKDAAGNVSPTAAASILLDQTAPSNGSAAALPGSSQVTVSWSGVTDAGSGLAPAPYKLFSSTTDFPASCSGTPLFSGSQISFTHSSLTNSEAHTSELYSPGNLVSTSSLITTSAT